jgi:hypothetical protein
MDIEGAAWPFGSLISLATMESNSTSQRFENRPIER